MTDEITTEIQLSRYADGLLCLLYKKYLQRRRGVYKEEKAKKFSVEEIRMFGERYIPGGAVNACNELRDNKFIDFNSMGDNKICFLYLRSNAIEYMQSRCKESGFCLSNHISKSLFDF